jgi:hypothetical protein
MAALTVRHARHAWRRAILALFLGIYVPLGLAAVLPVRAAASDAIVATGDFPAFWTGFRAALLREDWKSVIAHTRVPLPQAGQLDSDRVRNLSANVLPAELKKAMQAPTGLAIGQTQASLVRDTQIPTATMLQTSKNARVGGMVFEKAASGWRLSRIYRED